MFRVVTEAPQSIVVNIVSPIRPRSTDRKFLLAVKPGSRRCQLTVVWMHQKAGGSGSSLSEWGEKQTKRLSGWNRSHCQQKVKIISIKQDNCLATSKGQKPWLRRPVFQVAIETGRWIVQALPPRKRLSQPQIPIPELRFELLQSAYKSSIASQFNKRSNRMQLGVQKSSKSWERRWLKLMPEGASSPKAGCVSGWSNKCVGPNFANSPILPPPWLWWLVLRNRNGQVKQAAGQISRPPGGQRTD
jgi:hypothetical protein